MSAILPLSPARPAIDKRGAAAGARHAKAEQRRLVVVSNRLPAERGKSTGGLAVAVQTALSQSGGIWFGWSGHVGVASRSPHIIEAGRIVYATVDLSRQDYEEYYNGYANRVLWPLFHYRAGLVEFRRQDLAGYLRVNRHFAESLAAMLRPSDLVWVHDYHLIPLGTELRRLGMTRQPLGFFLHTPFPPAEMLRVLPNHRDLIRALCQYDLIGFQTEGDVHGFRDYVLRECGAVDLGEGYLRVDDRLIRVAAFPIGIDADLIAELAHESVQSRQTRRLLDSLRDRALIVGVDRLDYSKGLLARFEAFEQLIETYPETRGHVTFMQVAPPTRSEVPEYLEIRRSLEAAAGHINGRFAEFDWTPLRYLNKTFNQRTLTGFFRVSRIGLVTPLRDGMNLVAKEWVASQDPGNPGALVLSCFAGSASELGEALIVNPFDRMEITEAMQRGLTMPLEERQERWRAMMVTLRRNSINAWRENFVGSLREVRPVA